LFKPNFEFDMWVFHIESQGIFLAIWEPPVKYRPLLAKVKITIKSST